MKLFLLFFTLCSFDLLAQSGSQKFANAVNDKGEKQGWWEKKDGNFVQYRGFFESGQPVGEFKRYDTKGVLQSIQNFTLGDSLSSVTYYNKQGGVIAEGYHWGRLKHGLWVFYASNEIILRREQYDKGRLDGKVYLYTPKGVLMELSHWSCGQLHGVRKGYYEHGELEYEMSYQQGMKTGAYNQWYDDGRLRVQGHFKADEKDGVWKYYHKAGEGSNEFFEVEYRKGKEVRNTYRGEDVNAVIEAVSKGERKFIDPKRYESNPMELMSLEGVERPQN